MAICLNECAKFKYARLGNIQNVSNSKFNKTLSVNTQNTLRIITTLTIKLDYSTQPIFPSHRVAEDRLVQPYCDL